MKNETFADESVENLFSAPLLRLLWSDVGGLNEQLKTSILEKSKMIQSVRQSNKGGWQSPRDFHNWKEACVERFLAMVDIGVVRLTSACAGATRLDDESLKWNIAAWANINRYSNYNGLHNHGGGFWSGVYYVSCGKLQNPLSQEGCISFRNPTLAPLAIANLRPHSMVREIFKTNCTVKPLGGLMLLFPSWLEHYVHPYFGEEPRISISWDVFFPQ